MLSVVQDFFNSCYYEKELDTILILTPEEEFELGFKYYPERFVTISLGRIPTCKGDALPLFSSFASRAELEFEAGECAYHIIGPNYVNFTPILSQEKHEL